MRRGKSKLSALRSIYNVSGLAGARHLTDRKR
jgi:hypothetical protein